MLLISLIAFSPVLTTQETYISEERTRLFMIVILTFKGNLLCYQMLRVVFKFDFLVVENFICNYFPHYL